MKDPKDAIYAALSEDFMRRMRNWVRGRDGVSVNTSSFREVVDTSGYREAAMPTMIGEAQDTEAAIRRLPQRYQEVVACFWMYESRPLSWMARATTRLRLWRLDPPAFAARVTQGHEQLRMEVARIRETERKRGAASAAAQVR